FNGQEMTWHATLGWNQNPYSLGLGFSFQSPYLAGVGTFPFTVLNVNSLSAENATSGIPGRVSGGQTAPATLTCVGSVTKISALFFIDLNAGYTIPEGWYSGITGMQVNLSVKNLFDWDPPYQDNAQGMAAGDQLGRTITISIKKSF